MAFLQLVRWKNLLILVLTQSVAWWCVALPLPRAVLTPVNFLCLALSTMLIAAGGYMANDYFDIKIDLANKPEKVVVGTFISGKQVILYYAILNIAALALAAYVAAQAHHFPWLIIQVASILLLWYYSTHFKRMFMAGNLVVSLLTALTIIMLFIYEPALWRYIKHPLSEKSIGLNPAMVLFVYAFFAFMLTWMREVVKDMEDLKGDAEQGCNTMPVKWGIQDTVRFTVMLAIITIIVLACCCVCLFSSGGMASGIYVVILLILPLLAWVVSLRKNITPIDFHRSSSRLKLIMLSGIASLIVYHCIVWIRLF